MFLSRLFRASTHRANPRRSIRKSPRLSIDPLEDRCVPATFRVNTLADTVAVNLVTGQDASGNISLRSAISAANATPGGNTILLTEQGIYRITIPGAGEDLNMTGDFDILPSGGNLTIENASGGKVAVDGGGLDRVFDINPTAGPTPTGYLVTFQNLTIQDGVAVTTTGNPDGPDASGGGIRALGATSVTLNNVNLLNNSATADGGGIVMENAQISTKWTLTVNGGTISGNHAGDAGGGIDSDGGGKVNINGAVISNNTSTNQGAGIWLDAVGPGNVATIAVTNGGMGYTTAPTVIITPAMGDGGTGATAVATIANGMVTGATITNGGAGYATPPIITFMGGGGTGAMATATLNNTFQTANLKVTGSVISNNLAFAAANVGGGIGNAGNGAVIIDSSTVYGNFSGGVGGGFGDENHVGSLLVLNSTFANNVAIGNGGGISSSGTSTVIEDSTITGNTSQGNAGSVSAVLVTNGGSGYDPANPPTVTFSAPGGMGNTTATGTALVNAAGQVVGVAITDGGTGYMTTATVTFAAPATGTTATGLVVINGVGGGVSVTTAPFTLNNTVVAGNFSNSGNMNFQGNAPDAFGVVTTGNGDFIGNNDGNLIGLSKTSNGNQIGAPDMILNPLLGPLQNNGGLTPTEAPLPGSPLLDLGVKSVVPTTDPITGAAITDQRGGPRFQGNTVDIGAVQEITYAVAEFPGAGVWLHSSTGGWQQLLSVDASQLAVDDHGDAAAVFPNGLWILPYGATNWIPLTPAIPSHIDVAGNGIVVAEFPGAGVWRHGDPNFAGGGWQQLTPADALSVAVDDLGDTVASFQGHGVFLYQDASGWQQVTAATATQVSIAASGNSFAAEFQGHGVWRYLLQGTNPGWQQVTTSDASQLAVGFSGAVVCELGDGVWLFPEGESEQHLTTALASQVGISDTDTVFAEFQGAGVWQHTGNGWMNLSPAQAKLLHGAGG
jgi:hypothetical protein